MSIFSPVKIGRWAREYQRSRTSIMFLALALIRTLYPRDPGWPIIFVYLEFSSNRALIVLIVGTRDL
jgi:hypothetical protein